MNIEESIKQIETLIEAWQLDEADLNQTDINAMQVLLKEMQELELELSGYRQAILKDKEMLGLKEENKKYKQVIDKAINDLNIIIDIVRELPLGSDCWIIDRLEANKSILKEAE